MGALEPSNGFIVGRLSAGDVLTGIRVGLTVTIAELSVDFVQAVAPAREYCPAGHRKGQLTDEPLNGA